MSLSPAAVMHGDHHCLLKQVVGKTQLSIETAARVVRLDLNHIETSCGLWTALSLPSRDGSQSERLIWSVVVKWKPLKELY